MKIFAYVLIAAILEATGDAVIRLALHHPSWQGRLSLFLAGTVLLVLYATSLNFAPLDFAAVTGVYVATVFVIFQLNSYLYFHQTPTIKTFLGGALIIAGALVVTL